MNYLDILDTIAKAGASCLLVGGILLMIRGILSLLGCILGLWG